MRRIVVMFLVVAAHLPIAAQSIEFTHVPPSGTGGDIHGYVTGVDPRGYKLALINDVFGSLWSKPTFATPSVQINGNGTFSARFITGGQDICAQRVLFFLVPVDAEVPTVPGGSSIPPALVEMAVATAVAERGAQETFEWSGRTWTVRDTGHCVWGAGPNHFSKDSVSVDELGRLHLTVRYVDGYWRCAEIISTESFGYGIYRFHVASDLGGLPEPVVAGFFVYDDDPAHAHREIDVEFSRGQVVGEPKPWQFVVQPYTAADQRHRFALPAGATELVHSFSWLPGTVTFSAHEARPTFGERFLVEYKIESSTDPGGLWFETTEVEPIRVAPPADIIVYDGQQGGWHLRRYLRARLVAFDRESDRAAIESWSTTSGVPPEGNEKVFINLWLHDDTAPGPESEVYEVVLERFEFEPVEDIIPTLRPKLRLSDVESSSEAASTSMKLRLTVPAK